MKVYYTLSLEEEEEKDFLELIKDHPKWKDQISKSHGFYLINPIQSSKQFIGCASSGFCYSCKIIVADPTCFCMGGNCPKCGKFVQSRSEPEDLDGIYEKHYVRNCLPMIKQRFEKGKWKETIIV